MIPILLLVVTVLSFTNISFADSLSSIFNADNVPAPSGGVSTIDNSVNKIWGSVVLILQVLSVTAFISAGVRYMFSSADTRANIKVQMMWLIIGSLFVFASSTIVGFITKAAEEVL